MIKSNYEFFGTKKRINITSSQEQEYFDYLIEEICKIKLNNKNYNKTVEILGKVIYNILFWHNHDSIPWSKCQRMYDYSIIELKEIL